MFELCELHILVQPLHLCLMLLYLKYMGFTPKFTPNLPPKFIPLIY